jgi:PPOX class probable F420-dependent enzyme
MGVRLEGQELEDFLTQGHTLILSTIRKSGEPFMTPLWYVWMDGAFFISTIATSPKVKHVARDPRVCCMVEDGEKWVDLRAVIANCDATVVEDPAVIARFNAARDAKYAAFARETVAAPEVTTKHYAQSRVYLKLVPRPGEMRSWYNRKIRMKP